MGVDGRTTAGLTALAGILFACAKATSTAVKRRVVIGSLVVMLPVVFLYVRDFVKITGVAGTQDAPFFGRVTISLGVGLVMGAIGSILTIGALALLVIVNTKRT